MGSEMCIRDRIDLGQDSGLVEKSGSWFSVQGTRIGQGRDNARHYLADNPEIAKTIENTIRANAGLLDEAMLQTSDAKPVDAADKGLDKPE